VADAARPDTNRRRGLVVAVVALGIAALLAVGVLLGTRLAAPSAPAESRPAAVAPSESPTPTVADIYDRVVVSMVVITADRDRLGSGVVANRAGAILTAEHVVSGADTIHVAFADGTETTATVASSDEASDIAILIPADLPETLVPATLGGTVEVGGSVVAIGNPLGLAASASAGVVSGLDRRADTADGTFAGLIQFDAAVNPGSSGGPLLDAGGHVVGIVVSIADPGKDRAFAGIGFAVPIGTALGGDGPGPQI
jgi:S1-C subfamily serine protease